MFGAILNLLVFVIIIVLVVRRFSRGSHSNRSARPAMVLRRVFQYIVLYGLLVIVAIGLSGLLAPLLEDASFVSGSRNALARSLAFIVVGVPIFAGVVVWTRRRFAASRDEGDSVEWGLYITAAGITSLAVSMASASEILQWALGTSTYNGSDLAQLLVWGTTWVIHYRLSRTVTSFERGRPHHIIGAVIGVAVAVGGLITLLAAALDRLFFASGSLISGDRDLKEGLAALIVGAVVWVFYWFARVMSSPRDTLWLAYVLLLGIAGGLAMWVIAASTALYRVAVWFIGDPSAPTAAGHFANLPTLIATGVVGLLVWWYHRLVLASGPQTGRTEVSRIYEYLISGIGLLAGAAGLAAVIIAIFDAITGTTVIAGGSAINTLLAAVTLLVVGLPFWWVFWTRAQRAAAATPDIEVPSISRRTYLFLLFGVGGITAIISLLVAVYAFFSDLVESQIGAQTVRDMRIPLSILIATGLVSAYHIAVYNRDRRLVITETARGPRFVLLIGADEQTRRRVAEVTEAQVQAWKRVGVDAMPGVDQILDALRSAHAEDVLVLSRGDHLEVITITPAD